MPIIKATAKTEKEQIRIAIEKKVLDSIQQYCDWVGIKHPVPGFAIKSVIRIHSV